MPKDRPKRTTTAKRGVHRRKQSAQQTKAAKDELRRRETAARQARARREKAIILYDAAYEAFITQDDIAHSIYEVDGAQEVAIEFRSFSKTAGFTGVRCAYAVVPKQLKAYTKDGTGADVHALWNRRHCTKFNGVSYIVRLRDLL